VAATITKNSVGSSKPYRFIYGVIAPTQYLLDSNSYNTESNLLA